MMQHMTINLILDLVIEITFYRHKMVLIYQDNSDYGVSWIICLDLLLRWYI